MRELPAVILGMNNPHSARPDSALLPYPARCAGWNLWRMVQDVCGVSRAEYCRLTERRNLLDARAWDYCAAAERVHDAWRTLEDRRVIFLGATVLRLMRLPRVAPASWTLDKPRNTAWSWLPHPSGLCRDYNDPVMRIAAGMHIEEELHRASS